MKKAGIIGGGGYTAGELLRLLVHHPGVDIAYVYSRSQAGKPVTSVHDDLIGDTDLLFQDTFHEAVDVLFLCMPHGEAGKFLEEHEFPDDLLIIDLSNDFRYKSTGDGFVYGLPELNRDAIAAGKKIANPGCFATAIQLALLPMADQQQIKSEVHIHAITGSTGAGQQLQATSHFSWRNNNISVYKAFNHQHLHEIRASLEQLQPEGVPGLNFIPVRGNFSRGIMASVYFELPGVEIGAIQQGYRDFYRDHPFVVISRENPHLKQVVNTNKCLLYVEKHEEKVLIISMIDNLVKGASGQAVQNMNLGLGFAETLGLQLKTIAY
ncbi:MAG: N-acetyl-gamma-glutamyl-phosphate reductase [Saprospiraceae bacterium]|nr:N-acetyl-gamma-glutamyl-phosphate reductase [Saprospiraceae bacterium]